MFGNILITIPYLPFLKLNRVEKINYKDHDELVRNSAMFYSRILEGELVEGNSEIISRLISYVLESIDRNNLSSLRKKYPSDDWRDMASGYYMDGKRRNILNKLLVGTSFDNVRELVWFILMFLEQTLDVWDKFTDRDIDSIEKVLFKATKDKIRREAGYTHEKEIVLLDKRLVLPYGTSVDYMGSRIISEPDSKKLIKKLQDLNIIIEDLD
jgi:hypothetical protein